MVTNEGRIGHVTPAERFLQTAKDIARDLRTHAVLGATVIMTITAGVTPEVVGAQGPTKGAPTPTTSSGSPDWIPKIGMPDVSGVASLPWVPLTEGFAAGLVVGLAVGAVRGKRTIAQIESQADAQIGAAKAQAEKAAGDARKAKAEADGARQSLSAMGEAADTLITFDTLSAIASLVVCVSAVALPYVLNQFSPDSAKGQTPADRLAFTIGVITAARLAGSWLERKIDGLDRSMKSKGQHTALETVSAQTHEWAIDVGGATAILTATGAIPPAAAIPTLTFAGIVAYVTRSHLGISGVVR